MAVPTPEEAVDLMYRSSTVGAPSSEFEKFGGYAAVKAIAQQASFDATPTFVQSYEQSNAIPASASTIANQQFIGTGGQERFAQQEADLMSPDAALAAATRQRIADQFAAAQATVAARAPVTARQTAAQSATGLSIVEAYKRVLGRIPNADEIAYWTNVYGYNVDPTELSNFSVAAQKELAAKPTTNDAVRQMYLSVLGREPDASGLKYFSDLFGTSIDASELGIFKGMATQEINANAARNAGTTTGTGTTTRTGTTTGTVQPITRPPPIRQVTGTQFAPAAVTNTAITGTPFTNIYQPSTMQQNAPLLSDIQAAAQSANPYASLMALTPQRTLSPAYAQQAGQTTYNTNLGGFNSVSPNAAATTSGLLTTPGGADGVNNSSGDYGGTGGTSNTGTGQTLAGTVANLSGEALRGGFPNLGGFIAGALPVGSTYNKTDLTTGLPTTGSFTLADLAALGNKDAIAALAAEAALAPGRAAANAATIAGFGTDVGSADAGSARGGEGDGGGGARAGGGATGGGYMAKGGMVTPQQVKGRNPPGPDDGYTGLDIGEYVIRKKAVQKYGANIFEKINAGQIPAKRLKSLLE